MTAKRVRHMSPGCSRYGASTGERHTHTFLSTFDVPINLPSRYREGAWILKSQPESMEVSDGPAKITMNQFLTYCRPLCKGAFCPLKLVLCAIATAFTRIRPVSCRGTRQCPAEAGPQRLSRRYHAHAFASAAKHLVVSVQPGDASESACRRDLPAAGEDRRKRSQARHPRSSTAPGMPVAFKP